MARTGSLERTVEAEEDEEDEAWPGLLEPMQRESMGCGRRASTCEVERE